MRRDDEAVLAGRGGFPGADVIEVSVHATRQRFGQEEGPSPLTLAHLAELVARCEALGIDPGTTVVWQQTDGDGETTRVRCTGAGVRRPIEETALRPRTDADVAVARQRHAQAWQEGYDAHDIDTVRRRAEIERGGDPDAALVTGNPYRDGTRSDDLPCVCGDRQDRHGPVLEGGCRLCPCLGFNLAPTPTTRQLSEALIDDAADRATEAADRLGKRLP